ncbi:hypothetical protein GGH91_006588 [Coemansia sp. RSA 2671]|nr:hypothetical protein GGH91_006588 [Coemansia sp. RSA 2671]
MLNRRKSWQYVLLAMAGSAALGLGHGSAARDQCKVGSSIGASRSRAEELCNDSGKPYMGKYGAVPRLAKRLGVDFDDDGRASVKQVTILLATFATCAGYALSRF